MIAPIPFKQTNVMKAVIVPFSDSKLRLPLPHLAFVIPVNPETYNESLKINSDERVASGGQRTDTRYLTTSPEKLKLDFFLDGTNTIQGYFNPGNLPVLAQIIRLKAAVYDLAGEIHRPRFLKVFWGSLVFCGVLADMELNYTLFNPLGIPIRAKVSMNFTQHEDPEIGIRKSRKESPDVTHERDFKEGHRLDNMSAEIYNDPNLVLQLAKANKLTSFRKVPVGTKVVFPPIDKDLN